MSKVAIVTTVRKKNSCHPVTLKWFSIRLLVNSGFFKLSLTFPYAFKGSNLPVINFKGILSSVMLKEIFQDSLKTPKFTRICTENPSGVNGCQKLFYSYKSL